MNDSMEKRVATAMSEAADMWALGTDNMAHECPYDVLARAAIEAMREPTAAMLNAWPAGNHGAGHERSIWQAMIDAALARAEASS